MSNVAALTADQGSTRSFVITVRDQNNMLFNLTGCTLRAQVRTAYSSSSTVINATSANGKIALTDAVNGVLTWTLTPDDTANKPLFSGNDDSVELVYDIEVQDPTGRVFKPVRGTLTLNREVTR